MKQIKKIIAHALRGTLLNAVQQRISRSMAYRKDLKKYKEIGSQTPFIGVYDGDFPYIVSTSDYSTGFKLFRYKINLYEKLESLYEWCGLHLDYFHDPNKIIVNVGAHVGCVAIPAVGRGHFKSAIVFEPEPLNYKLLEINLRFNNVHQRIAAYRTALSNENRKKAMYLSEHNLGAHAVFDGDVTQEQLTGRDQENKLKFDEIKVDCQTFDYFAKSHNIDVSDIGLVFIDIEGHEGHFFEGAQTLLNRRIPIVTEFCPQFLRRSSGLDKFLDNVLPNFSRVVVNPIKRDPSEFEISDIKTIKNLIHTDNLYDLLLIP